MTGHLGQLPALRYLYLNNTKVGDAGLEHLKGLEGLMRLNSGSSGICAGGEH